MLVLFTCCWGSDSSIQAEVGKLNGDLLQLSGMRYEVWSFSVRYLISIAYWKGLISGVKLSIMVPQAIGIYLCKRIGDYAVEFLVVVLWGFSIGIQWLWIALFVLFTCCWGSDSSIQAEVGKINRDLIQLSGIRYEVWSFSVRYLISIAYC